VFHREHHRLYGYSTPGREIEIVTVRVRSRRTTNRPKLPREPRENGDSETRSVWIEGAWRSAPVWKRAQLSSRPKAGPALILDYGSTTLIPSGWEYRRDTTGNLIITA
jgi:N-methylhydantoinase A